MGPEATNVFVHSHSYHIAKRFWKRGGTLAETDFPWTRSPHVSVFNVPF
jgi:hypothetical protein